MTNPTPIEDVLVDGQNVNKGSLRSYENARSTVVMTGTDEVRNGDLALVRLIYVDPYFYKRDTSDTTSADDGITVIVDGVGTRFKMVPLTSLVPDAVVANTTARDALDVSDKPVGYSVLVTDDGGFYFLLSALWLGFRKTPPAPARA